MFGGDILGSADRLIKWSEAEHGLSPDRFSIRSFRAGGASCLYHAGVDMEYIMRILRRRSSNFAIYLHFDAILRNYPA